MFDPEKVITEVKEKYFSCFQFGSAGDESVSLENSFGRVLAENLISDHQVPRFVRSLTDGYAVSSADTGFISEDGPVVLKITGKVEMGKVPTSLPGINCAFSIPTGGMLPDGADAVVRLEQAELLTPETVKINSTVMCGENIELDGLVMARGVKVLEKGVLIGSEEMAILAEFGIKEVKVKKQPVVAVFSSGDELATINEPLSGSMIRDTNSYLLCGLVKEAGGKPLLCGIVRDVLDDVVNLVSPALEKADMVIMSGGTAVGGKDFTAEAFDKLGKPGVIVNGVKVKQGRPIVLAAANGKPVIGVAGYPPGAKFCFDLIARPLIHHLLGCVTPK